jgi:PAS domain S-box-containing protein
MLRARSAQELVGRPSLDFVHPDFHPAVLDRLWQASEHGLGAPLLEAKVVRCDGTLIDVEIQSLPIVYDGRAAMLVSMHDVTEFRQAQIELARSHGDLQRLLAAQDKILEEER